MPREQDFRAAHPQAYFLDPADCEGLSAYLEQRGWLPASSMPIRVEKAGEGNMNCTLRVITPSRSLIVKQGRPWVEKYDHIAAPWDRTLIEGAFYQTIERCPAVAAMMPRLVGVDCDSHILALEDIAGGEDCTTLYAGGRLSVADATHLVGYLSALHHTPVPPALRDTFANRRMRELNHAHLFQIPVKEDNGLSLDAVTPGLGAVARLMIHDREYVRNVARLGDIYLSPGDMLLHGDYFPGSWLRSPRGFTIIDPEFCFLGRPEFDLGVMLAHQRLSDDWDALSDVTLQEYAGPRTLDRSLVYGFAGVEIMRRLIGVAQLPVSGELRWKTDLLAFSRDLVMSARRDRRS